MLLYMKIWTCCSKYYLHRKTYRINICSSSDENSLFYCPYIVAIEMLTMEWVSWCTLVKFATIFHNEWYALALEVTRYFMVWTQRKGIFLFPPSFSFISKLCCAFMFIMSWLEQQNFLKTHQWKWKADVCRMASNVRLERNCHAPPTGVTLLSEAFVRNKSVIAKQKCQPVCVFLSTERFYTGLHFFSFFSLFFVRAGYLHSWSNTFTSTCLSFHCFLLEVLQYNYRLSIE